MREKIALLDLSRFEVQFLAGVSYKIGSANDVATRII